jgi:hypothetical protein
LWTWDSIPDRTQPTALGLGLHEPAASPTLAQPRLFDIVGTSGTTGRDESVRALQPEEFDRDVSCQLSAQPLDIN